MTDNEVYYKIIWHQGGLNMAEMQWFDEMDYNLASSKQFATAKEAYDYGKELAEDRNLVWYGKAEHQGILD